MERKKKICKTCGEPNYIWAYGNCKYCAAKVKKPKRVAVRESLGTLIKDRDGLYSRVKRLEAANKYGFLKCYICNKTIHWERAHLMHYKGRAHMNTRTDDRNCHAGCVTCNSFKDGNIERYEEKLIKEYGKTILEDLDRDAKISPTYTKLSLRAYINHLQIEEEYLLSKIEAYES